MLLDLQLDDQLRLRKAHPCGSYEWKVVRLGADIGIECLGCGRRVLLPRRQLARRVKTILTRQHPLEDKTPTTDPSRVEQISPAVKQPPIKSISGSHTFADES
jgi:hypothetical protein